MLDAEWLVHVKNTVNNCGFANIWDQQEIVNTVG